MNNRLEDLFRDPSEPDWTPDYFVVGTTRGAIMVSRETAIEVERWLDHQPPPRWVVFHDLSGSRHRIMTALICNITESTAAQRAKDREFERARRLEEKRDRRPWDEDD